MNDMRNREATISSIEFSKLGAELIEREFDGISSRKRSMLYHFGQLLLKQLFEEQ